MELPKSQDALARSMIDDSARPSPNAMHPITTGSLIAKSRSSTAALVLSPKRNAALLF
jgi:hypothetical protein